MRLQDLDDDRVAFPDGLADEFFGQAPAAPSAWIEAAGGIDGAIDGDAVLLADDVIFLAVAGSGVDGAGALFERDVIAEDAERNRARGRGGGRRRARARAVEARRGLWVRPSAHFAAVASSRSAATM